MSNGSTPEQKLGDYIFKSNPYTQKENPGDPYPTPMQPLLEDTEEEYYTTVWYFRNGSYRIAKALRIPYRYTNDEGLPVREYLLIGYEGAGGGN